VVKNLGGPGSIPGMECLRSITPLAHLILRNASGRFCKQTASVRRHSLLRGYSRSSTAIERPDSDPGDVGSIPIGSVTFDGPLSLGYR
jgi:hypothetical protein